MYCITVPVLTRNVTIHQTHDLIQFNLWFNCFSLINFWFLKIITSLTLCTDCRLHLQIPLQKVLNVLLEVCKFICRHKIPKIFNRNTQLDGALLKSHFFINLSENHTERREKKKHQTQTHKLFRPDINISLRSTWNKPVHHLDKQTPVQIMQN